ncbi:hypothetical protein C1890_27625 [Pseudomonas sp. DP16D-R1]|nr:hypothetical protein C1890_27625 [Pseudomonas sp. DP16D-R1]
MRQRSRQALIISAAAIALAVIANSVINRGICSYYGYQTDRETKYAPFVGCIPIPSPLTLTPQKRLTVWQP